MTDDMLAGPSVMGVDWNTLRGRLLAVFPYGRETAMTRFGESACVRADIYDLDVGEPVSMDALIFPRALVRQSSGIEPGKAVIGRLGQGEARGGQNAPWILLDPAPEDFDRARAYFAQHKPRAVILREQRQQSMQPAQQPQSWGQPTQTQAHGSYGQPTGSQPARAVPPPPPGGQSGQGAPERSWGSWGPARGGTDDPPF